MIVLPTLSRICNKYKDLFDGYDTKKYYVQYLGSGYLLLEKKGNGEILLEMRVHVRDKARALAQFMKELSENLEEVVREAEELLSAP